MNVLTNAEIYTKMINEGHYQSGGFMCFSIRDGDHDLDKETRERGVKAIHDFIRELMGTESRFMGGIELTIFESFVSALMELCIKSKPGSDGSAYKFCTDLAMLVYRDWDRRFVIVRQAIIAFYRDNNHGDLTSRTCAQAVSSGAYSYTGHGLDGERTPMYMCIALGNMISSLTDFEIAVCAAEVNEYLNFVNDLAGPHPVGSSCTTLATALKRHVGEPTDSVMTFMLHEIYSNWLNRPMTIDGIMTLHSVAMDEKR